MNKPTRKTRGKPDAAERARLLRANLRRRKAQARQRRQAGGDKQADETARQR